MIPLLSKFIKLGPKVVCGDCKTELPIRVASQYGSMDLENEREISAPTLKRLYTDLYRDRFNCSCGSIACKKTYWVEHGPQLVGPMCAMCFMTFLQEDAGGDGMVMEDYKIYVALNEPKLWQLLEKHDFTHEDLDDEDDDEMLF